MLMGAVEDAASAAQAVIEPESRHDIDVTQPLTLYSLNVIRVCNQQNGSYYVKLLTYDDHARRFFVNLKIPNADYVDITYRTPSKHRELDRIEEFAQIVAKKYPYINRVDVKQSCWINFGADPIYYLRVYLNGTGAAKMLEMDLGQEYDIVIGNAFIPSRYNRMSPKLKHCGVQLYNWFTINRYDIFDNEISAHLNDIVTHENYNVKPMYPKFEYDIEVYNSDVLMREGMPNINNLSSYINCISVMITLDDRPVQKVTIVVCPFPDLQLQTATIVVGSEKELLEVWIRMLHKSRAFYIIDYNGMYFDMRWIVYRIVTHELDKLFKSLFEVEQYASSKGLDIIMADRVKSKYLSVEKHATLDVVMSIRGSTLAHLDLMYFVQTHELYSKKLGYGLDAMGEHLNVGSKLEVEHRRMSIMYYIWSKLAGNENNIEVYTALVNEIKESTKLYVTKLAALNWPEVIALQNMDYRGFMSEFKSMITHYSNYCAVDVQVMHDISVKLNFINTLHEIARTTAITARLALCRGSSFRADSIVLYFMLLTGYTYHDLGEIEMRQRSEDEGKVEKLGGITLPMLPQNLDKPMMFMSFDFHSAYPSVIEDVNISPEMILHPLHKDGKVIKNIPGYTVFTLPKNDGTTVTRYVRNDKKGILGTIERTLVKMRDVKKKELRSLIENNKPQYLIDNAQASQLALKLVSVTIYGRMGSRFSSTSPVASNIMSTMVTVCTAVSIKMCMMYLFLKYGLIPVIGVTDSGGFSVNYDWPTLFGCQHGDQTAMLIIAKKIAPIIEDELNELMQQIFGKECMMSIALEYIGMPLRGEKMKRYATCKLNLKYDTIEEAHANGRYKIVGYSQVRSNTSPAIVELSQCINKIMLDHHATDTNKIIRTVIDFFDEMRNNYDLWAEPATCSFDRPDMLTFQAHSMLLYALNRGYRSPPLSRERVNVISIDHGCRRIGLDGSMKSWGAGMMYIDVNDAKLKQLPLNLRQIKEDILKLLKEFFGTESIIYKQVSIEFKANNAMKEPVCNLSKKERLQWCDFMTEKLGFAHMKYLKLEMIERFNIISDLLITNILRPQNKDGYEIAQNNAERSALVPIVKKSLDTAIKRSCLGLRTRLSIHLSMMCRDGQKYAQSQSFTSEIFMLKTELHKVDNIIEKELSRLG